MLKKLLNLNGFSFQKQWLSLKIYLLLNVPYTCDLFCAQEFHLLLFLFIRLSIIGVLFS